MRLTAFLPAALFLFLIAICPVAAPAQVAADLRSGQALKPLRRNLDTVSAPTAHAFEQLERSTDELTLRRVRNHGWLIGGAVGGALGAWFGHNYWRGDDRHAAPSISPASYMIGFGLIAGAVGSVIGGVLGSK